MKTTKEKTISFRVTPEMKAAIKVIAKKERRSMSSMILIFIEEGLKLYSKKHDIEMPSLP